MKRQFLSAAVAAAVLAFPLSAQQAPTPVLQPGAQVRLTIPSMAQRPIQGTFLFADSASLFVATGRMGADTLPVPRDIVKEIRFRNSARLSTGTRLRRASRGALQGAVGMFLLSAAYQGIRKHESYRESVWTLSAKRAAAAGAAGAAAAFVFSSGPRWERATPPPPSTLPRP